MFRRGQRGRRRPKDSARSGVFLKPSIRTVPTPSQVMPDILRTKLVTWVEDKAQGGVTTKTYSFQANSAFDPDLGLSGSKPNGFNELSDFFIRYKVNACGIEIKTAYTLATPIRLSVYATQSATPLSTHRAIVEQPYSQSLLLAPDVDKGTINMLWSTKKIMGGHFSDRDYSSVFTSSPVQMWHIHVKLESADGSTLLGTDQVFISFKITQYCEFFQKKALGTS